MQGGTDCERHPAADDQLSELSNLSNLSNEQNEQNEQNEGNEHSEHNERNEQNEEDVVDPVDSGGCPPCQETFGRAPEIPPPRCPLCSIDEVVPETAVTVPSDNAYIRRIMSEELAHYGTLPDDVIYGNIARTYNKHIQVGANTAECE